eukprot:TRINITY_DN13051_c0_g2_i2.p1 TRINITY_DN13051_c0_g2~~TRINITY_DN13051_c0_g2_i2.p1  ORF type:complete len:165 (-),score=15.81 TRINITY_DN13051_c0_g2_i2:174-668(-)
MRGCCHGANVRPLAVVLHVLWLLCWRGMQAWRRTYMDVTQDEDTRRHSTATIVTYNCQSCTDMQRLEEIHEEFSSAHIIMMQCTRRARRGEDEYEVDFVKGFCKADVRCHVVGGIQTSRSCAKPVSSSNWHGRQRQTRRSCRRRSEAALCVVCCRRAAGAGRGR